MNSFANRSEEIFFACCRARGWAVTKIPAPGNKRTPDFVVRAGDITFIAEIKEFHSPKNPKSTNRHRPAQKLRKAINNARGQLKGQDCPTMLVILDMTGNDYARPENIRTAFLGEGKNKHAHNTQISAVGVILDIGGIFKLQIFTNPTAIHPLPETTEITEEHTSNRE